MDKSSDVTIHKLWKYVKYEVINPNPKKGLSFGMDKFSFLDLTDNDSLKFIVENSKKPADLIPYKIIDKAIIINIDNNESRADDKQIVFRIWKLTANDLILLVTTRQDINKPVDSRIGWIFKADR